MPLKPDMNLLKVPLLNSITSDCSVFCRSFSLEVNVSLRVVQRQRQRARERPGQRPRPRQRQRQEVRHCWTVKNYTTNSLNVNVEVLEGKTGKLKDMSDFDKSQTLMAR